MSFRIGRKHAVHSYPEPAKAGPPGPPGPGGGVQIIRYQVGPGPGTFTSATLMPVGAIVLGSSFDNNPADDTANLPFAADNTATIGTTGDATLCQDTPDNTPDVAGNYENFLNKLLTVGNIGTGAIVTVIAGSANAGIAHVTVEYAVPQP